METIEADVVVVGGGGAGLRAAYEAAKAGARTALVLKGHVTRSGATAFGVAELAGFSVPDGAVDPLELASGALQRHHEGWTRMQRSKADPDPDV